MTRRGRSVLVLGFVVYVAAWAFGSKPLYPVAAGLLLVCLLAWGWVRAAHRPIRIERRSPTREHVEGDDVEQRVVVHPSGPVPPPSASLVERIGRLGEQRHVLRRNGRRLFADYHLRALPRGRYVFSESRIEIRDPFGLEQRDVAVASPGALLVYPRVVRLEHLFSESGAHALEGRRLMLRRPTGFDLHSVRDYVHGESLRKVHWRTTARRGQLMVKELEDAPRDEIAVLLDADARAVAGDSFEVQVRAAASVLDAYVRRNRRAVLVVNSANRASLHVHSAVDDRTRALELLAGVEPDARAPLIALLADEASPVARALELVVVTGRVDAPLVDRLVQRSLAHRRASLVYVDAPTFAGGASTTEPLLLRLASSGVPVASVRSDDDLGTALAGNGQAHAAYG